MPDFEKILQDAEKMDKEVKEFLIVNHSTEETTEFNNRLAKDYAYINENYNTIFKMVSSGSMDITKLKFMITMLQKVQDNKMSEESASIEVGKQLFNEYVAPNVKK